MYNNINLTFSVISLGKSMRENIMPALLLIIGFVIYIYLSNYWLYFTIWNTSYYFIYCSFGWNNFILGIFRIYTKL